MEPVFQFPLALPERGQGTLTQALHQQLRAAIVDGRLAAGSALPATRQVASALGIARNTVVTAYDLLIAEGYATPRTGAKAVVADVAGRRDRRGPRSLAAGIEDPRLNPFWRTPFLRPEPPRRLPERCFRLGISRTTCGGACRRNRCARGRRPVSAIRRRRASPNCARRSLSTSRSRARWPASPTM
jgi:GntR family transcriptional regulator/MocR family aminotransferase